MEGGWFEQNPNFHEKKLEAPRPKQTRTSRNMGTIRHLILLHLFFFLCVRYMSCPGCIDDFVEMKNCGVGLSGN